MSWAETKTINSNPQVPLNKLLATKVGTYDSGDVISKVTDFDGLVRTTGEDLIYNEQTFKVNTVYTKDVVRDEDDTADSSMSSTHQVLYRPDGKKTFLFYTGDLSTSYKATVDSYSNNIYIFKAFAYLYFPEINKTISLGNMLEDEWFTLIYDSSLWSSRSIYQNIECYPLNMKNKNLYIISRSCTAYYRYNSYYYYPITQRTIGILDLQNEDATYTELYTDKYTYNINKNNNCSYYQTPASLYLDINGSKYLSMVINGYIESGSSGYKVLDSANNIMQSANVNGGNYKSSREIIIDLEDKSVVCMSGFSTYNYTGSGVTHRNGIGTGGSTGLGENNTISITNKRYILNDDYSLYKILVSSGKINIQKIVSTYDSTNNKFSTEYKYVYTDNLERYCYYYGSGSNYYYESNYMGVFDGCLFCFPPKAEVYNERVTSVLGATITTNSSYYINYRTDPYMVIDITTDNPKKVYLDTLMNIDSLTYEMYNTITQKILFSIGLKSISHNANATAMAEVASNTSNNSYMVFSGGTAKEYVYSSTVYNYMNQSSSTTSWNDGMVTLDGHESYIRKTSSYQDVIDTIIDLMSVSYVDVSATAGMKVVYGTEYVNRVEGDVTITDYGCLCNSDGMIRIYRKHYVPMPITIAY